MMRVYTWLIVFLVISCPYYSFAQQQSAAENALDSVVIKDNRLQLTLNEQNRNIAVLTADQIKRLPVKSVNELLSYMGGVDLRQRGVNGAQADVSIDGSTFDQVLVLMNGVKLSDPQTGHNMLNLSVPLSAIDHIEVLRGPAARVYGVNALAGAINIVTKKPTQNEVYAQAYMGSNFQKDTATGKTYIGWGAQATGAWATARSSQLLSLSHDEGNGYRYNTGYNGNRVTYTNTYKINGNNKIDATGAYARNFFGGNGFYSAPGDKESQETVQTALGSLGYTWTSSRVKIMPRISYRYNKDDYIYIRQKPQVYHNIHETNVVTGEIQSTVAVAKGTLGLGTELRNEDIASSNLGKHNRNNLGLYAEYRKLFFKQLNLSAGLYGNYNSDYDFKLYPGADAGYFFTDKLKITAAFSSGQRLPTYTDLYYKGPLNIGNSSLRPEFASYYEAGIQYSNIKAVYFYKHVTDFIDWVRASVSDPWQPHNFQTMNTEGVTVSVNQEMSSLLHLPTRYRLLANASYTYLHPSIEASNEYISKYSIEALRHQFIARVAGSINNRLDVNLAARYQQRINANDYTLLDARAEYHLHKISVYADVNNILNTQYKEIGTIQMPGRWVTLGVKARL